ncbi:Panacea domain-containing protein [Parasediminibacterium sp. JCM 36343]|uniref:Panacea domain-containing protein n=1 Tax=Parasediminibacterium sp. JCM 36343 TaxID=3374279 RepID=UPI00397C7034
MKYANAYIDEQIEKLGNTLVYLANNVGEFNKTKALKLLFLLEENSIEEFGVPFFGFDFKVWQFGPVVPLVYNDFNEELKILSKYIKVVSPSIEEYEAIAEFDDGEFSDNDLYLLDRIKNFARHKTATDLVNHTHKKGSLWQNAVDENNLKESFENKTLKTTDISIDFFTLVKNDQYLKERYQSSLEYIQFNNYLKS